jgi:translation initiation factor eIF-2B subunit alpha
MAADKLAPTPSGKDAPARSPTPLSAVRTKNGDIFDLVATYNRLLSEDEELSMPVAAIEALIELLSHTTASTVFETIEILNTQIALLKTSVANPIPATAGAELFMKTLLRSLRQETGDKGSRVASNSEMSFDEMRQHLVHNSRNFASQAKASRVAIANVGARYVRPGSTVMTSGGSRCVKQLLLRAAERRTELHGSPDFRVIYVMDGSADSEPAVKALRQRGVPVSTIDVASTSHAILLGKVDRIFVGAEAVCQRGGVLSRMGTLQLASLAKQFNKDFYVVTETHKFAMTLPLDQKDVAGKLGIKQTILDFQRGGDEDAPVPESPSQWRADYTVGPELFCKYEKGKKKKKITDKLLASANGQSLHYGAGREDSCIHSRLCPQYLCLLSSVSWHWTEPQCLQ